MLEFTRVTLRVKQTARFCQSSLLTTTKTTMTIGAMCSASAPLTKPSNTCAEGNEKAKKERREERGRGEREHGKR